MDHFGRLAGWVASMIARTTPQWGFSANIIVGIIGAFIGGFIMNLLGARADVTGFNIVSFLVALLGSIILLAIINLVRRGSIRNQPK